MVTEKCNAKLQFLHIFKINSLVMDFCCLCLKSQSGMGQCRGLISDENKSPV